MFRKLLSERRADGTIPYHPYQKWRGAHWVLWILAEMGYPAGDRSLLPLREQVLGWLLSDGHLKSVKVLGNRARRCGSQEGNAAWALMKLGLADERVDRLLQNLMCWQWPDGGWNCDKHPAADTSSFHETLPPLRALALHAKRNGNRDSQKAAKLAAEVFLCRRLFRGRRSGRIIDHSFVKLSFPSYWHYNILAGLVAMNEAGFLGDPRCREALDLLGSKRLPDGGWPAELRYYRVSSKLTTGTSIVDWGGTNAKRMNPWVTAKARAVLAAAGRA